MRGREYGVRAFPHSLIAYQLTAVFYELIHQRRSRWLFSLSQSFCILYPGIRLSRYAQNFIEWFFSRI
ncbi:MAG: hypothetical protein H6Q53_1800, partial [Deltaproteobacteria bacterium]|nr:hypothetical protein [Deltaproteobacteria bacterium]